MTWSDFAIFDKKKMYHIVPERFQFGYCRSNDPEKAGSYNQNSYFNEWEVSSHKHGNHMGYIINNDVIFWTVPNVAI